MRWALIAACAALAACDEPAPPPPDPVLERLAKSADPAMQSAAEKECAEVTNYSPGKMTGMTSEMRALMQREYAACVAKVSAAP